jgi:hypothetical protein
VYLDLFVVAPQQAAADHLTTISSDVYRLRPDAGWGGQDVVPGFVGERFRTTIGHPAAAATLWDGCVLTRLSGSLRPEQMSRDLTKE